MSDVEDDLEFFAAFEDELYKETSSMKRYYHAMCLKSFITQDKNIMKFNTGP